MNRRFRGCSIRRLGYEQRCGERNVKARAGFDGAEPGTRRAQGLVTPSQWAGDNFENDMKLTSRNTLANDSSVIGLLTSIKLLLTAGKGLNFLVLPRRRWYFIIGDQSPL